MSIFLPIDKMKSSIAGNRLKLVVSGAGLVLLTVFILYILMHRLVIKPLKDFEKMTSEIGRGNLDARVNVETGDEFEKQALDGLVRYTKTHFAREEGLMKDNGYPDYAAHKAEHEAMIARVNEFLDLYEDKGHLALEEAADYLKSWLITHINGTDQKYSPYLREKGVT